MKRLGFLLFAICLLGISLAPISAGMKAATADTFFVSLPEAGQISVRVPAKWQASLASVDKADTAGKPASASVKINAPDDFPLSMMVTIIDLAVPGNERLRKTLAEKNLTESLAEPAKESVEKKVNVQPLETKLGPGAYAVITDASLVGKDPLPKDDFLKATSGQIVSKRCIVLFTIFSHETESEQYRQAMKIISEGLAGGESN
jgi:hypothetical protein